MSVVEKLRATVRWTACLVLSAGLLVSAGCGSRTKPIGGTTSLTVLGTSTANDRLSDYGIRFKQLSLTSQSGKTVNLLASPQGFEFLGRNGIYAPLLTASVPSDLYTTATATVESAQFTCVEPGGTSTYASSAVQASAVSVAVPTAIDLSSKSAVLALDLLVSQSASLVSCDPTGPQAYTITPSFLLSAATTGSDQTTAVHVSGLITAVNTLTGVTVTTTDASQWSASLGGGTTFGGVAGAASLAVGMPVEVDAAIQPDGQVEATRVEVEDQTPENLSVASGPVLFVQGYEPGLYFLGQTTEGTLYDETGTPIGSQAFSFPSAVFGTFGGAAKLAGLPFAASFTAENIVAGQNVSLTFHSVHVIADYPWIAAATVTLMPQTINGSIVSIASTGGATAYTVALGADDPLTTMPAQEGQASQITTPGTVVVYVTGDTSLRTTGPIAGGSVVRFRGLLFNDQGVMKMACSQVSDGVME